MDDGLIELDLICERYFGVTPKIARRKAALGTLPVAAFRLSGNRRGPLLVRKDDLDALVAKSASQAQELQRQMARAGAV